MNSAFFNRLGVALGALTILLAFSVPASAKTKKKATIKKKLKKKAPVIVSVLYFDYDGKNTELTNLRKGLAQMLISDLSEVKGITLVERARLEEVLKEIKLSRSTKFDPKTANRVGKLLGARYIVMGGFFVFSNKLRIDSRIVDVETGKIVGTFGDNSKLEEFLQLEVALADSLGNTLATLPSTRRYNRKRKARKKPKIRLEAPTVAKNKKKSKSPTVVLEKLDAPTVALYGDALDAYDSGNKELSAKKLKQVLAKAPTFKLAAADLARLAK